MMKSTVLALAVVLLPAVALSSPASDEQETAVAMTRGAAVASRLAAEPLHGIVDSVDQGNDTIDIRLSPDKTERFRVQDGLMFNAVRYVDPVEITVQNITGAMTIVGLRKE